jgi:glycosyltransferase involved in cell wall biosynthesis
MDASGLPVVAVVISTRNRGPLISMALQSILRNSCLDWELIVVDQSDGCETKECIDRFAADPRLHYIRSNSRGLSVGRNIGISASRCGIIAVTDDDCETDSNWLDEIVLALTRDRRIGVVLGNVRQGSHDRRAGFIPAYVRSSPVVAHSVLSKHRIEGIGACMGLRRSCWEKLHGFDACLGAGARFRSAEETDFVIRALSNGFSILETPKVQVIHHGFRTWERRDELICGHLYGLGAAYAKQLKCRNWKIVPVLFCLAARWAFAGPKVDFGRFPPQRIRLASFLAGSRAGLRTRVDCKVGHYCCG